MERERLDKLVRDPLAVERQDLAGLKDLAERSPWFTGAQLLRAAGERSLGDVGFDATLQRTALDGDNLFAALMDAAKVCSLGQISSALYAVGGQYRRNM